MAVVGAIVPTQLSVSHGVGVRRRSLVPVLDFAIPAPARVVSRMYARPRHRFGFWQSARSIEISRSISKTRPRRSRGPRPMRLQQPAATKVGNPEACSTRGQRLLFLLSFDQCL